MNPSPQGDIHVKLYWGIIMSEGGSCMNVLLTSEECCCPYRLGQRVVVCQSVSMGLMADRWLNVQSSADKGYNEES